MVTNASLFMVSNRGRPGLRWLLCAALAVPLFLCAHPPATAQPLREGLGKASDLPPWQIRKWQEVYRPDLTYFAWYSSPLGDINDDGYDDFAISSRTDTTYIFLGGEVFSHDPAFKVRGGSAGVASADFNGDGKLDIVTSINNLWNEPGENPPEERGAIRIFLWKPGPLPYTWEPDRLIEGEPGECLGTEYFGGPFYSSVQILDYNGDGRPDMATIAYDERDSVDYKGVLLLGKENLVFGRAGEMRLVPRKINEHYANDVHTGDINGDGCDDILLYASNRGQPYWDVFLGNTRGEVSTPDRVLHSTTGWSPQRSTSAIMDIDGDGYDDILDAGAPSIHRQFGDALLFHGRAILPDIILPDDSIPNDNAWEYGYLSPQIACPVGDMNGDGRADLLLAWNLALVPGATGYYFYPGGDKFKTALGFFGTDPVQHNIYMGAFPVGDVNGDGYDDVLTRGYGYKHAESNRFQLYLGARQLSTAVEARPAFGVSDFELAPNPLPVANGLLRLRATNLAPGTVHLQLHDILGKLLLEKDLLSEDGTIGTTITLPPLAAGSYHVTLRQAKALLRKTLVVQ